MREKKRKISYFGHILRGSKYRVLQLIPKGKKLRVVVDPGENNNPG